MCLFSVLYPSVTLLYNTNDIDISHLSMINYACTVCSMVSIYEFTVISFIKTEGVKNDDDDDK